MNAMSAMRYAVVLLALFAFGMSEASAAFRWPWDIPHKRNRHKRIVVHHKITPVDCKRINEAVAYLSKDELDKELSRLNKRRQRAIAQCRERAE